MKTRIKKYQKLFLKKSLYHEYKEWCEINDLNQ